MFNFDDDCLLYSLICASNSIVLIDDEKYSKILQIIIWLACLITVV